MNRNIIFTFLLLISTTLFFSGCKKYKEDFLGPEYIEASENFAVENNSFQIWRKNKNSGLEAMISGGTASFGANYQYYKAKFNERVSWTIKVTAWSTGAQRLIKGVSDSLNIRNTIWDGGANNGLFFSTNDSIEISIHFAGSDLVLRDTLKLTGVKTYNYTDPETGVKYFTVDDFEGLLYAETAIATPYLDAMDLGGGNSINTAYAGDKVQGLFSVRFYGRDVNNNTYLGGCNTPALNDFPLGTFTTTNPDSLFINMYVKGFANRSNTTLNLLVLENDADQPLLTYNTKDEFGNDVIINDRWSYLLPVDWDGWKLVSIPYSAFTRPNSNAAKGDGLLSPNKFCGIIMEMNSYPTGGSEIEALVDMVVITQNGRFKQ